MELDVKLISENKIIEIIYPEIVTPEILQNALFKAMSIGNPEKVLCLADCRNMVEGHNLIDIYGVIKTLQSSGIYFLREAMLVSTDTPIKQNFDFFETVGTNRGYTIKQFTDREEALNWLNG